MQIVMTAVPKVPDLAVTIVGRSKPADPAPVGKSQTVVPAPTSSGGDGRQGMKRIRDASAPAEASQMLMMMLMMTMWL